MENVANKFIEVAGDKASQIGIYWFLDRMVGYVFYIIVFLIVARAVTKILNRAQELEEQRLDMQARINELSNREYLDRFKNWPKLPIEERDKNG